MAYLLIVLILFISVFLFFGTSNNQGNSKSTKIKDTIKEYLSKFDMYICIKNKLLLFPSKELNISNKNIQYHIHPHQKTSYLLRLEEQKYETPIHIQYDSILKYRLL